MYDEISCGNFLWEFSMGISYGNFLWKFRRGIFYGNLLWEFPMEISSTYSPSPSRTFFSRTRPASTRASRSGPSSAWYEFSTFTTNRSLPPGLHQVPRGGEVHSVANPFPHTQSFWLIHNLTSPLPLLSLTKKTSVGGGGKLLAPSFHGWEGAFGYQHPPPPHPNQASFENLRGRKKSGSKKNQPEKGS